MARLAASDNLAHLLSKTQHTVRVLRVPADLDSKMENHKNISVRCSAFDVVNAMSLAEVLPSTYNRPELQHNYDDCVPGNDTVSANLRRFTIIRGIRKR